MACSFVRRIALCLIAILAGCRLGAGERLDKDQAARLETYVDAFEFCVAESSSRLDDGASAIVRIAALAVRFCEPEVHNVATFLDSTPLSDGVKADYLVALVAVTTNRSANLLRQLRDRHGAREDV